MRFSALSTIVRGAALVLFAALVVACSSSQISTPGPVPIPSSAPLSSSATVTTSTTSTVTLPAIGTSGYTVSGTLPIASVVATLTESSSATAPSGISPLSKARRGTLSSSTDDLLYLTFSSPVAVTLTSIPALSFTSSQIAAGTSYYLALNTGSGWQAPLEGPATVSGTTASFASIAGTLSIPANGSVTFLLYTGTAALPVASPNALSFDASNPSAQSFGVSETGYGGAFNATMVCTENPAGQAPSSDAYVAQFTGGSSSASETPSSSGGSASFGVTSGAETGTCTVTVSDTNSNTTTVTITVTGTGLNVY